MLVDQIITIDEKIFPIYKIVVLVNELKKQGIESFEALHDAGLTEDMLSQSTTRISAKQVIKVYENSLELSNDPAIGLDAGQKIHITNYGMYGYALISSKNLREALKFSIKYHKLATPTVKMTLKENSKHGMFEVKNMLFDEEDIIQFNLEFQFSLILSLFRDMLGKEFKLAEVRFKHSKPSHFDAYEKIFDSPIMFDQNNNQFRFDRNWLNKELVYSNPITSEMSIKLCDRALDELNMQYGLAYKVFTILLDSKDKLPSLEQIAKILNMTSRTLRRKLKLQGTSFQEILNCVRKSLAINYLDSTNFSTEEIAVKLGYSNSSNFRQAFKKWTNKSPTEHRAT